MSSNFVIFNLDPTFIPIMIVIIITATAITAMILVLEDVSVLFCKQRLDDDVNANRPVLQYLCDKADNLVKISVKKFVKSDEVSLAENEVNDIVDRYEKLRATIDERKKELHEAEKNVEQYNVVLLPAKETMSAVNFALESEVPSVTEAELVKEEIKKIEVSFYLMF